MRIEIFRTGKHTDSAGVVKEWTEADLDTIASSYDAKTHEAPITIGHPKDDAPAWGWVKSVMREGSRLFAEVGDVVDEFATMLDKKMFKKRSMSVYPDLKLRHVAFLGAQPPAVKGLEDFKFSEVDAGRAHSFMDWEVSWGFNSFGRIAQGIRDYFIETKDVATADRLVPQHEIDSLKNMRAEPVGGFGYNETSTEDIDMDKVTELETKLNSFGEKLELANASITSLQGKATAAEARATTAEAEVATLKREKKVGEYIAFAERMVLAGKLTPANKARAIARMERLADAQEIEFSEGTGAAAKVVKVSALKDYMDELEASAPQVSFGEFATNGRSVPAASDDKLTAETKKIQAANPGMSFNEAGRKAREQNPELNVAEDI